MLGLKYETPPDWVKQLEGHLDEVLIDHAHCEKKAAGTAMNLIFAYVERADLVEALSEIVAEELDHLKQVLALLSARNIEFRRIPPSRYGGRLKKLVRQSEPERFVDRLLIGAIIEARSCERFALLRDHLEDREVAEFLGTLFESEARHYGIYVRLARTAVDESVVKERLEELLEEEAAIIEQGDELRRLHS